MKYLLALALMLALLPINAYAAPLFGVNGHPWASTFRNDIPAIAATPGMGIVRLDEYVATTPVANVVADYDFVRSYGLVEDLVIISPCCDITTYRNYVKAVALALGPTRTVVLEIQNEPDAQGFGLPWPAATYHDLVAQTKAAIAETGLTNIYLSMAGLTLNDQAYLAAANLSSLVQFSNVHLYTEGGAPHVGPLAPDDPDTAHNGLFSFTLGIDQFQAALPGKGLIISEAGWGLQNMTEYQRAAYTDRMVVLAKAKQVTALILYQYGSGDPSFDLTNSLTMKAFSQAIVN